MTNKPTGILRNFIWLSTNSAISIFANIASIIVLAQKLTVSDYGKLSIILALTSWIIVLRTSLGSDLIRKTAKNFQFAKSSFFPLFIFSLFSVSILIGIILVINVFFLKISLIILISFLLSFLLLTLAVIPIAIFTGMEKMHWQLLDSANSILLLGGIILLPVNSNIFYNVGLLYLFSAGIIFLISFIAGYHAIRPGFKLWDYIVFKQIAGDISLLFVTNILITLHLNLGLYLIYFLSNDLNVGIYSISFKMVITLRQLPLLLMMSFIPKIVKSISMANYEYPVRIWKQNAVLLLLISQYIVFILIIFSSSLVPFLFTSKYINSIGILIILSFAITPIFLESLTQSILFANGNYKQLSISFLWAFIMQVLLGTVLIRFFGKEGAAVSFIISETIAVILLAYFFTHTFGNIKFSTVKKIIFNNVLFSILAVILSRVFTNLTIVFLGVIILYTMTIWFFKIITRSQIKLLADKFSRSIALR